MLGSLAVITVKLAAFLLVVAVMVGGLLVLRMEHGPLSIAALTPIIEDSLSAADGSYRVHVEDTMLAIAGGGANLQIVARGVRVDSRDGAMRATVPELALGLDIKALTRGLVAPTRIVVSQPQLHLVRDATGKFQLGLGEGEDGDHDLLGVLLAELLAPPDPLRATGYLEEVSLRGAKLTVEDRLLGVSWSASRATTTVFRNKRGIFGDIALAVDVEDRTAALDGEFRFVAADHQLTMTLSLADWEMAKLQRIVPSFSPLGGLRMPIGGTAELAMDTTSGALEGARVDLIAGTGSLVAPELPGGAVPIAGAKISASYDPKSARLTLHNFALDFAGPTATVSATVDGLAPEWLMRGTVPPGTELAIAANAEVLRMPANDLTQFWPPSLAHNARVWVTNNIRDGVVDEARLTTRLRLQADRQPAAVLDAFGGTLRMRGLTVDYKHPLPPVLKVDGSATYDATHMELLPTSGVLKGQRITGGKIVITDLDKVDQFIDINLDVKGPLRDALEVVDSKPLQYAREVGLDPARVEGVADGHLYFRFMLDHRTRLDDVELAVRAQIADAAIRKVAFEQDLEDGTLQLRLDRAQMQVDGTAKLGGVPATLGWLQYFKARDGVRSRYTVRATLDDQARQKFGFGIPADVIVGPVAVNAMLTGLANKRGDAAVDLDLGGAALSLPDLNWAKPPGTPATAKLQLELADDRVSAIREATVKGQGIGLRVSAAYGAPGQGVQRVELKQFVLGKTDMTGTLARRPEGGWRANLAGGSLDATALLDNLTKPGPSRHGDPPLVIDGKFTRVIFGPEREARDVVAQLYSDGNHWQSVRLDLVPAPSATLRLRFGQTGGERPFDFSTSDLGATLRLLDVSDHVTGGQLSATGHAEDNGLDRRFIGQFDGSDYKVVGAPVMAQLLSLASFTSIASLLSGEGIPFARLTGDFVAQDGKVTIKQGRAYGGAVGINASGMVDLGGNMLDLEGTLVPAYMLNSIIGKIPLIGNFLVGGEGQGLFAVQFHASGAFDDPKVSVNPLSALAPGALRNLFLFEPGDPDAQAPSRGGGN